MFGGKEIKELQARTACLEVDSSRRTRAIYDILIPLQRDVELLKELTLPVKTYDYFSEMLDDVMLLFGWRPGQNNYELTRLSVKQKIENYINSRPKGVN